VDVICSLSRKYKNAKMLLLKKEKQQESNLFKQRQSTAKKQSILIELKEKELKTQALSTDITTVVGVLGFEKVGKSRILQSFYKNLDLTPTKRVSLTSTGLGLTLIDTPPITSKSSKRYGQREISEFIMRTCHVVLLVTDQERDKDLIDHLKSSYTKTTDKFSPHVIIILNKYKSDSELDDIKKFYKKQLQGIDICLFNNTTQPKSSRPLFFSPADRQIALETVNFYKLGVIEDSSTFSNQARFEVACQQLKSDILSIEPLQGTDRWALKEKEWFNLANCEWQKILQRSK
jgi:GTPase SAR1 family protein